MGANPDPKLLNPERMIEDWATHYPVTLRPKLNPRRFRADTERLHDGSYRAKGEIDPSLGRTKPAKLHHDRFLIPFRGVASDDNTIEWPPSRDIVMNVAGFEEALSSSVSLTVADNLMIRVASLPALTLLKLIAWSDRAVKPTKTPPISTYF